MANNRLYLVDTVTGKYTIIAKNSGCEWYCIDVHMETGRSVQNRLNELFEDAVTDSGDRFILISEDTSQAEQYSKYLCNEEGRIK